MRSWRAIVVLAVLAAVSAGLAAWAWWQVRAPLQVAGQGELLLPELGRRLQEVARMEVRRGGDTLVLQRQADGRWLAGEAAWPVEPGQVRSVLLTLAEMRKVRPATALPERYRYIRVDDPNPDSLATRLVLKDAKGKVLADIILGKEAASWLGGGRQAQFVRLAGARRSWLVEGHVRAPLRVADWADTTLLKLPAEKLAEVEIRRAEGDVVRLVAVRDKGQGKDDPWRDLPLRLADAPPGAKPHAPGVQRLANALEELSFEEVRRDALVKGDKPLARVLVRGRDGLQVALQVYHRKGKGDDAGWWLRGEVLAKGGDAQLAEKLRERFRGRVFKVYDSVGEILSARLEDFIRAEVHDLQKENAESGNGTAPAAGTTGE